MVELKSAPAANNLVNSPFLELQKLRAFIPSYRVLRTGVIKDIPTGFNDESILKTVESPLKVIEIKRLNRKVRVNGVISYIPSGTVCIKFAGQSLPKHIYLYKTKHDVSPFIPNVKIYYSCFRVGHIGSACKGSPRCLTCGNDKHSNESECPLKSSPSVCINYKGPHLASLLMNVS